MNFRPTPKQLELISLTHARAPVDKICAALGITEADFSAWAGRLAVGRAWSALPPAAAPEPVAPVDPRIRAQRLFEGEALDGRNAASVDTPAGRQNCLVLRHHSRNKRIIEQT